VEERDFLERVRERLERRTVRELPDELGTRAAVLVPLYFVDRVPHLLFNLRTQQVLHHKGQIAFPGGVREPEDADLAATALRESEEELGLEPAEVQLLGRLDDFLTVTHYVVRPHVGLIPYPYEFRPSPLEVEEVFGVAIPRLIEPDGYTEQQVTFEGHEHMVPYFEVDGRTIWGATGRLLHQFLTEILDWQPPAG